LIENYSALWPFIFVAMAFPLVATEHNQIGDAAIKSKHRLAEQQRTPKRLSQFSSYDFG